VARVRADERLVENQVRLLEPGLDVADDPFIGVLAERQLSLPCRVEILVGPLELLHLRSCRRGALCGLRPDPDVAFGARVRRTGPEALDRIDDERQPLVFDVDALDGFGSRQLVNGSDCENRLALVERLHRQSALAQRAGDDALAEIGAGDDCRQIVCGEDRLDAREGQRRGGVDADDARMRHRAEEELREQHPLAAEVFGVFRFAGDLGDEIRGGVVEAYEFFQPSKPPGGKRETRRGRRGSKGRRSAERKGTERRGLNAEASAPLRPLLPRVLGVRSCGPFLVRGWPA
jgi:hypothetical protein